MERFMKFRPIVGKIAYDTKARLSVFETRERGLDLTEALEKMEFEMERINMRNRLWGALRRRNWTLLKQTIDLGKQVDYVALADNNTTKIRAADLYRGGNNWNRPQYAHIRSKIENLILARQEKMDAHEDYIDQLSHENHETEMRKLQVLLDKTKEDAKAKIASIKRDE